MTERSPNPQPERFLLAAILLILLVFAGLHAISPMAARQHDGTPLVAWLDVGEEGKSGLSAAKYIVIYSWQRRILDLVRVDTFLLDLPDLARSPAISLNVRLPAIFGAPSSPEAVKAWILSWPRDARFWLRLPRVTRLLRAGTSPPMPLYDLYLLALEGYRLRPEAIRLAWLPKPPEDRRLLGILLGQDPTPVPVSLADRPASVTVQILNASGDGGVALQATKVLRLRKADVVDFGNAPAAAERTQLIDRSGDYEAAAQIRQALGCGPRTEIIIRIEPNPRAVVTVMLGKDYQECRALSPSRTPG